MAFGIITPLSSVPRSEFINPYIDQWWYKHPPNMGICMHMFLPNFWPWHTYYRWLYIPFHFHLHTRYVQKLIVTQPCSSIYIYIHIDIIALHIPSICHVVGKLLQAPWLPTPRSLHRSLHSPLDSYWNKIHKIGYVHPINRRGCFRMGDPQVNTVLILIHGLITWMIWGTPLT